GGSRAVRPAVHLLRSRLDRPCRTRRRVPQAADPRSRLRSPQPRSQALVLALLLAALLATASESGTFAATAASVPPAHAGTLAPADTLTRVPGTTLRFGLAATGVAARTGLTAGKGARSTLHGPLRWFGLTSEATLTFDAT